MRKLIAALSTATLLLSVPAMGSAKDKGHGKKHGKEYARSYDGHRGHASYRACPPGLAKKRNGCVPPGQARKAYWNEGSRVPVGYSSWTRYDAIPERYRSQVPYNADYRYIYRDDQVYAVDPKTRLVQEVINLLGR
jgi:Ni/Co efflux regulator RcnB